MDAFAPIALADKRVIDGYLKLYPFNQGSECTFSNLYIWGKAEGVRYAIEDDCLILYAFERRCMLMAFAREDRLCRAIDLAVEASSALGAPFLMSSIPGWYKEKMERLFPGRFAFVREPHHDDYIYDAQSLRTLAGGKLHGKRNHINKFLSLYGDNWAYAPYEPGRLDECMALEAAWARAQVGGGALTKTLRDEAESVRRALEGAAALSLTGGVLEVGGKAEAFTLGELIAGDMALIHVEKANAAVPGAFAMINREFIARAVPDAQAVNREEDMGDEGLMRAKKSYCPVRMIEKYGARLAE
jgi:hypothetical protein